jgi:uncharacterized protein YqjF (DUF2071 family)
MRLPTIQGVIRRRILVNFRVEPEVIQRLLPTRFRPKLQDGYAVAGICLIRLEHVRPKILPGLFGFSSENAAHRVAVLWDDETGSTHEGVFIPRRDTNSPLNLLLGGRMFPGEHNPALFKVRDSGGKIRFSMRSRDGSVAVQLAGSVAGSLPARSIFPSLPVVSSFFEAGSLGYSLTHDVGRLDGLRLETREWRVEPLHIAKVFSSFFADEAKFPKGSVRFDNALLMRNIAHEWHTAADLHV